MNFRTHERNEPEINLIAFIDVLLVVLIFLMLSTTYKHFTELQLNLPTANTQAQSHAEQQVEVSVSSDGAYAVNRVPVPGAGVAQVAAALRDASPAGAQTVVVIKADARAKHQAVITVMEAAQSSGLAKITFATQSPGVAR
jgi:biopolymer transport protein ExbD